MIWLLMISTLSSNRRFFPNSDLLFEHLGTYAIYIFTKCVTKSCYLPNWLIQFLINRHHHRSRHQTDSTESTQILSKCCIVFVSEEIDTYYRFLDFKGNYRGLRKGVKICFKPGSRVPDICEKLSIYYLK